MNAEGIGPPSQCQREHRLTEAIERAYTQLRALRDGEKRMVLVDYLGSCWISMPGRSVCAGTVGIYTRAVLPLDLRADVFDVFHAIRGRR